MLPEEKEAYKIIYNGLKNQLYEIVVPSVLVSAQIQEIYLRVLYDNPLFYFVNQTVIRIVEQSELHILLPEYLYTANEIATLNKDIRRIVDKVAVKANQEGDFSGNDYHAWNLVKIETESYHVDVTWDNMYDKGLQHISYDYFNMTTEQIMLDH